jgi:hypothetical protein
MTTATMLTREERDRARQLARDNEQQPQFPAQTAYQGGDVSDWREMVSDEAMPGAFQQSAELPWVACDAETDWHSSVLICTRQAEHEGDHRDDVSGHCWPNDQVTTGWEPSATEEEYMARNHPTAMFTVAPPGSTATPENRNQ